MEPLSICLVSPYTLDGGHPVADQVGETAKQLAGRGHRVTVLAPSTSTRALRSGRRRLRALAQGDREALLGLPGEPLAVAVGPAVWLGQRGRGPGLPVAANANVALALAEGGFDVVDAHEPQLPGISAAAVKHARGLTAATFHAQSERAIATPIRERRRERNRARIDVLIATSDRAAALAGAIYPGQYVIVPPVIDPAFAPGAKDGRSIVVAAGSDARPVVRALVRMVARTPGVDLTLLWTRGGGRRPLRPHVPADARGRVHTAGVSSAADRAAVLATADVVVCPAPAGGDSRLAWEARAAGAVVVSPDGLLGLPFATDQPALAAAATGRLLEDGELRARLAGEGLEAVSGRRGDRTAERLEEIYSGLLRRRRAPHRPRPAGTTELINVDLHMHTSHSYDCATDVEALLDHCIEEGFGAIAITDHNEISGAFEAQELGKPITVIAGEEVMTSQGEVIGLFLKEKIERGMTMAETVAEIHRQGGLVLMPHPFDRLHTIPDAATLHRLLDEIDIFEVYNSRLMFDSFNDDALRFARKYNLVESAGSDAHVLPGIGTAVNRIPPFSGPEEFLVSMQHNQIERRPRSLLYLQGLKWMQQVGRTGS